MEHINSPSLDSGVQFILCIFQNVDLAFEFYKKKLDDMKKDPLTNPNQRCRIVPGRFHDSAFVKIANGKIIG